MGSCRTWGCSWVPMLAIGLLDFFFLGCSFTFPILRVRHGRYVEDEQLKDLADVARQRLHQAAGSMLAEEPWMFQELRAFTEERFPGGRHMLPSPSRGSLLRGLSASVPAEKVLEVGTFTGYSALCFMDAGATVLSIERCPHQAAAARQFAKRAGGGASSHHLEVEEGLAEEILPQLTGCYDLIHLDGSMKRYTQYLDQSLQRGLLAPHGLVLADNVLFRGRVARRSWAGAPESGGRLGKIAESLHRFNVKFLEDDPRTEGVILDQDDGLAVIWRRT